jgi:hypothetical protein
MAQVGAVIIGQDAVRERMAYQSLQGINPTPRQ